MTSRWTKEALTEPLDDPRRWEKEVLDEAIEAFNAEGYVGRGLVIDDIRLDGSTPETRLIVSATKRATGRSATFTYDLWGPEGSLVKGVREAPKPLGWNIAMWVAEDLRA